MTHERFIQLQEVYDRALACDEGRRSSFLHDACAGDEELRREVESLLAEEKRKRRPV
jgi:hypothetical protein